MSDVRRRRMADKGLRRSSSNSSRNRQNKTPNYIYKAIILIFASAGAFLYYFWLINTAQDELRLSELPNALIDDIYNESSWSTLRPQLYFGLKTKHPESPLFGLIWYKQPQELSIQSLPLRHWCEHGDDVKFSWTIHDGRTFGRQSIIDRDLEMHTNWLGIGQRSWSTRFTGQSNTSFALIFYLAIQDSSTQLNAVNKLRNSDFHFLSGTSPQFGQFQMKLRSNVSTLRKHAISNIAYRFSRQMDMRKVDELLLRYSLARPENGQLELVLHQNEQIPGPGNGEGQTNFVAFQYNLEGAFDLQLDFITDGDEHIKDFEKIFHKKMADFDQKFDKFFPIQYGNNPLKFRELAKTALSNILGGIGVWHGFSLARRTTDDESRPPMLYGPLSLISAVPSRPFFPRGFLWDEGFHNLLIHHFDPQLSLQILASWLNTMSANGWIPREQILGEEAQAKVPAEFIVQSPAVANPPMLFYVLEKFLLNMEIFKQHSQRIARLYPRLKQFYLWIRNTQRGPRPGTMQWQGRNATTNRELNPKSLPSGLDDFPRATHPTSDEYHLDLRCWMALGSRVLRQLAETFGDSEWVPTVELDVRLFNDLSELDKLHWSEPKQQYSDFGLHSERVQLVQEVLEKGGKKKEKSKGQSWEQERVFVRKTMEEPRLRLVDDVFGYLNLFPFLLRLLPTGSSKLGILLRKLNQTEHIWTPFGLRSLSAKSSYYLARNTEHDPPYWRGAIWININYLAITALHHYANSGGPHAGLSAQLYKGLRENVVQNIWEQHEKTGFFWEQYNDRTGEGMGTRPFTGWTALVANILAENY